MDTSSNLEVMAHGASRPMTAVIVSKFSFGRDTLLNGVNDE